MNDAINNIAGTIRERLYSGDFQCLDAYLSYIADLCYADGTGLVAIHEGRLRRQFSVGRPFKELEKDIHLKLSSLAKRSKWQSDESLGLWTNDGKYLLLRKIWLSPSWPKLAQETFWLYVLDPKAVIPPKDAANTQLVDQFGGIVSAFIRWNNELFVRHDELLLNPLDDSTAVLREFKKFLIRPVLPSQFREILTRFDPEHQDVYKWSREIAELETVCAKPKFSGGCRCQLTRGGQTKLKCPQTDENDRILSILAKLEIWRTGFWKIPTNERVVNNWKALLETALEGLKQSAVALHWQNVEGTEPIDFSRGAVGLAGERALLRHFCAHAIEQALSIHQPLWSDARIHSSELEFPSKLARLASTLLGDGKWTPDAIENLLQVVALYGHSVLGIPGRIDLVRHLRQTLRGETALHTLKSRYRDHFFHTLEVCFLGFAILRSRPDKSSNQTMAGWLLIKCGEFRKGKAPETLPSLAIDEHELMAQWWVAALVHDTAYGIDVYEGTLQLLDFFSNRRDVKTFLGKSRDTVGELGKSLSELANELKTDASLKKGDHGVIAAASLAEVLEKIGGQTAKRFLSSVRAIAFHNTRHPKVNAGADPIAALLILCDTVQEWGRSSLGFDRSPSVLLSRMMEASLTPAEEQFGPVKRYQLSMAHIAGTQSGVFHWQNRGALKLTLEYGKEVLTQCKGVFVWADTTYNLQRVNFEPWGFSLTIDVSVPKPDQNCTSQFGYLGDFIREQEVRFVQPWFQVAYKGDTDKAVAFREFIPSVGATLGDQSTGQEIITFNLVELGKEFLAENPLMGGTIGDFASAMMKWSVFARQQCESPPSHGAPI